MMVKRKKRILITGGCGFIGHHLTYALAKKNYEVHVIDKKIFNKINSKNIKYFKGDIKNPKTFDRHKYMYSAVFHLAAQSSARISEEKFKEGIETNFIGTLNLCNWAKSIKPKKIIFSSSMAVYRTSNFPLDEKSELKPTSVYGKSKIASEQMITELQKYNIKTQITRLFNVYGPGQNYKNLKQGMVSIYSYYAVFSKKIKVTGTLNRFRDFIYITDVVNIYLKLLKIDQNLLINVASGNKITVENLIKSICLISKINFNNSVKIISSHDGDVFGTYANVKKLYKFYRPKVKLKKGLQYLIADIKKFKRDQRH